MNTALIWILPNVGKHQMTLVISGTIESCDSMKVEDSLWPLDRRPRVRAIHSAGNVLSRGTKNQFSRDTRPFAERRGRPRLRGQIRINPTDNRKQEMAAES